MAIIYDPVTVTYEAEGTHFAASPHERTFLQRIRVGTLRPGRQVGPLGTHEWTRWSTDPRFRRSPHARQAYYQEVAAWVHPHARIRQHGVDIHVLHATQEHLEILDTTLAHVPPPHLEFLATEKPVGIGLSSYVGHPADPNFMGGQNAGRDMPYTPWDDTQAILVTYGALWSSRRSGVCVTLLHEIGHVMTHHGLSIARTDPELWEEVRHIRVSTNAGELEAVCDAYMHMLAAGSPIRSVQARNRNESNVLSSARMRAALLACPLFASLPDEWRERYR